MTILSVGTNAKTIKGDKSSEYLTAICYLSPHKQNERGINLCPKASNGCIKACLYSSGRGAFTNVQNARTRRSNLFVRDRAGFCDELHNELLNHSRSARLKGKKPAVRLNGTSDILWESLIDMSLYPEIQFYDYTKWKPEARKDLPDNYKLTFSRSEDTTDSVVTDVLKAGMNVAVVFDKLPKEYLGYPVIDGDLTDLRFLDDTGVIVGLTAKGAAKKDTSGFVVRT